MPEEADVLKRLVAWAETQPAVRAMIITSSRARADETVDALSDYDVIIAVTEPQTFTSTYDWTAAYAEPLARWGDEHELLEFATSFRGVVYTDGVKIDWTIWPVELVDRVAAAQVLPEELDIGYRVLLDKDGRTKAWQAPKYRAHIPNRPSADEYRALVEEFWWSSTYVAKALWRGELVFAKFPLDYDMKLGVLRRFLEWKIEIDRGWNVRPGVLGRGLERLLPPDLVEALHGTYAGAAIDENWDALFATAELFRRVAIDVGRELGYEYPHDVDARVTAQLRAVRELPPRAS